MSITIIAMNPELLRVSAMIWAGMGLGVLLGWIIFKSFLKPSDPLS